MNKPYNIERATSADIIEIQNLCHELCIYERDNCDATIDVDAPFSEQEKEYFLSCINSNDVCVLVVKIDEKVVGYLTGNVKGKQDFRNIESLAEVENMYIKTEYRNMGVGTDLLNQFKDWSKAKGVARLRVVVSEKNKKAVSFYKANGCGDYNLILEGDL